MSIKKISTEQLINIVTNTYTGKQVQVMLSYYKSTQSINTYQFFKIEELLHTIEFYDMNIDNQTPPPQLTIHKNSIKEIQYFEGDDSNNIYDTMFSIITDNGDISFTISEKPLVCKKCDKLLEKNVDLAWRINQVGEYGSQWDSERLTVDLCENCLTEFIGAEIGGEYCE